MCESDPVFVLFASLRQLASSDLTEYVDPAVT